MRAPTEVGSLSLEELSASFGEAFVGTRRGLRRATRREVGLTPLPEAQRELLLLVSRIPGVTVGGAAESLQLAPNTVSTLLRQLIGQGYLERTRDPANRRIVHMNLTERARQRISRYSGVRNSVLSRALATLPEADRARIEAALPALTRLAMALDAAPPPPDLAGG